MQNFWINQDLNPDICRIITKMSWIHYFIGVSHFAECRENRPMTIRNAIKSPKIPYSAILIVKINIYKVRH